MNLRLKLFLLLLTIEIVCAALGLLIYFLVWAQLWLLLVLLFVPGIAIGVIFSCTVRCPHCGMPLLLYHASPFLPMICRLRPQQVNARRLFCCYFRAEGECVRHADSRGAASAHA